MSIWAMPDVEPIPALLFVATLVDDTFGGYIHDLDELRTRQFGGAAGTQVVGIAGYPESCAAEAFSKRNQHAQTASRIAMAPVSSMDRVADVASIEHYVGRGTEAEIDAPEFHSRLRMQHSEAIRRHFVNGMIRQFDQFQTEISIVKIPAAH